MKTKPSIMVTALAGVFVLFVASLDEAAARGFGGGGGGRGGGAADGGGFSRSGPAASGGFSSSAATADRTSSISENQQNRQSAMSGNQAQRQSAYSENVETRQQGATARTTSRQQTAQQAAAQPGGAYYRPPAGAYPTTPAGRAARAEYYDDHTWDSGEVAAVAVGTAAVAGTAAYVAGKSSAESTTAPPPSGYASLPCNPNTAVVEGVTYYQCGSSWYVQAYGNAGAIYTPVPPPPGY